MTSLWLSNLFQSHNTPFTQIFCLCESMSLIGLSGKLNALKKKDFLHGPIPPWPLTYKHHSTSLYTLSLKAPCGCYNLNLRPRKCLKIPSYPLPKDTLCVKYESDWTKGREDILRTSDLGWTEGQKDGQTEGQTDYYRASQSGALFIYKLQKIVMYLWDFIS